MSEDKDKKEQLFKNIPSKEFVEDVLKLFIPNGFQDSYYQFSRKMITEKNVIEKLNLLKPQLKEYYMNCKHKKYLENLNEKKVITIFRQILRHYDFKINALEKYNNGEKYLLYIIEKKKNLTLKKIDSLISFD